MDSSFSSSSLPYFIALGALGILIGLAYLPEKNPKTPNEQQINLLSERLKNPSLTSLHFTSHELHLIETLLIDPTEIDVSFQDIGGIELQKDEIYDNLILPIIFMREREQKERETPPEKGSSTEREKDTQIKRNYISWPTGVLLYGNPGTGKTMIAKAIAKEAQVAFLSVKAGIIFDKYVGESEKIISSLFSLARKIAPCVIFIDEIDTLLRHRNSLSNNPIPGAFGVFLSEWDGLMTLNTQSFLPVVVLGATNRPNDIDPAFRRRMPMIINVPAPDYNARVKILQCILRRNGDLSDSIDLDNIASQLEGKTGSDLKELCRLAGINRMKRLISFSKQNKKEEKHDEISQLLSKDDFNFAMNRFLSNESRDSDQMTFSLNFDRNPSFH